MRRLAEVAREVDLVVDHAWADPMVLFDVLAIQSAGAKVLLHTHSVFSMTLLKRELHDRFQCLPDVAAMADGVVALTPADACYWAGGQCSGWGAIRRKNARWMQSRRSCGLAIACRGQS